MDKKYLVIGDYIRSKNDGQEHFVPASVLVRLYNVDPNECIMVDRGHELYALMGVAPEHRSRLIRLFPRYDGDYQILPASSRA
jgi:hypothetical protein